MSVRVDIFMKRLDQFLVESKKVESRTKAKTMILEGKVLIRGIPITVPHHMIKKEDQDLVEIVDHVFMVGRGYKKLASAWDDFAFTKRGFLQQPWKAVDLGASTGGFTQWMLEQGASQVFAIDVGHGQLHPQLMNDGRVINWEKTHIKDLSPFNEVIHLVVADLSFISLRQVLPLVWPLFQTPLTMLFLFKPQFEGTKELFGKRKKGILKDVAIQKEMLKQFILWCEEKSFFVTDVVDSKILGKEGNREFFLLFDRDGPLSGQQYLMNKCDQLFDKD
jgi:23S rRNA (cytidine1920-2'-O)/16S rRNA (cytidine1409-2'-O)-methyltransferase